MNEIFWELESPMFHDRSFSKCKEPANFTSNYTKTRDKTLVLFFLMGGSYFQH